jgi:hypothetical protein
MTPGLTRAAPIGVLGFIASAVIVTILRGALDIEPVWDLEVVFVLGVFVAVAGFVWGMGAFDPQMNQHAHEPNHDDADAAHHDESTSEEPAPFLTVFSSTIWLVFFWVLILMTIGGLIIAFSGMTITSTADPLAAANEAGNEVLNLAILGDDIAVNQAVMLMGFVMLIFVTLAVVAAIVAGIIVGLNRGIIQAKATPAREEGA